MPAPKFIIAGAPASGKGTQCEFIKAEFGCIHLSTGDMLRAAVEAGSDLGKEAKGHMDSGGLVPDKLIIDIIIARLAEADCVKKGWLLDGFPRTRAQADALATVGLSCDAFILLEVPDDLLVERVCGRRSDPLTGQIYHIKYKPPETEEIAARLTQRSDDTEEAIMVRIKNFHTNVASIIEAYASQVIRVNGTKKPAEVWESMKLEFPLSVGKGGESESGGEDATALASAPAPVPEAVAPEAVAPEPAQSLLAPALAVVASSETDDPDTPVKRKSLFSKVRKSLGFTSKPLLSDADLAAANNSNASASSTSAASLAPGFASKANVDADLAVPASVASSVTSPAPVAAGKGDGDGKEVATTVRPKSKSISSRIRKSLGFSGKNSLLSEDEAAATMDSTNSASTPVKQAISPVPVPALAPVPAEPVVAAEESPVVETEESPVVETDESPVVETEESPVVVSAEPKIAPPKVEITETVKVVPVESVSVSAPTPVKVPASANVPVVQNPMVAAGTAPAAPKFYGRETKDSVDPRLLPKKPEGCGCTIA